MFLSSVASRFAVRAFSVSAKSFAPVFYTRSHEWIDVDNTSATLGITDFAQKELGDVVFVELPDVGKKISAGDNFAAVESVKATSECYSPVSGTVSEINTALTDEPELINTDPQTKGWMVKLEGISQPEGLMNTDEYEAFCLSDDAHH
eukprot:TRINITY_DN1626_c0_g1_i1.p1 TRINITY_DN1626_c0_g1~~TRINITY_DN1626_c0_g1_i1.p1  ORF type:complete len:166 (-),score=63.46 TRINITY_DN1626_c0_g1_i1:25-468(-)